MADIAMAPYVNRPAGLAMEASGTRAGLPRVADWFSSRANATDLLAGLRPLIARRPSEGDADQLKMPGPFEPLDLGGVRLRDRVFMAPLTRNRALLDGLPGPWAATYLSAAKLCRPDHYRSHSDFGGGKGYVNTPGI